VAPLPNSSTKIRHFAQGSHRYRLAVTKTPSVRTFAKSCVPDERGLFLARYQHRLSFRHASIFVVAALALGACGVSGNPSALKETKSVTPTSYVEPSSLCTPNSNFINQSTTGRITGCFRVPANEGKSLVVSLKAYLDNSGINPSGPTTIHGSPSSGDLSLSLTTPSAKPGDHVTVVGTYAPGSSITKTSYAELCWNGCQTGLVEEGVPLHWTGPLSFHASLWVPSTAWLGVDQGGVSIQPLVSGSYDVAIQCVQQTSGCALGPPDAHTSINLKAPTPLRCVNKRPCVTLRLSTYRTAAGDEVIVNGWAPLQSIIGQPFGFDLSIAPSTSGHYAALSSSQSSKGGGYSVVVAPRILTVTPDHTWASLGLLSSLSSSWAGPSSLTPVPGSSEIAWCSPSGPRLSNGTTSTPVPTVSVSATLQGTGLSLLPGAVSTPQCATILVDPTHHSSIFVGFDVAVGGVIPPVYQAGLYTTNAGASWRWVPTPSGLSKQDFSGFETRGARVVAIFFDANQSDGGYNGHWPLGSNHGVIATEESTNGGLSWKASTLNCPVSGPCAAFGPYLIGNCAMNGTNQSLMLGAPGNTTGARGLWFNAPWVSTVNSCFSQQLVATSSHGLLLLDPSSQYELLQSLNSGQSWLNRSVPSVPDQTYPLSFGDALLFAPTGELLAMVTAPSNTQQLFRLAPGATSWCQVPNVFDKTKGAWFVDSIRVDTHDLLWSQTRSTNSTTHPSQLHELSLSKITC